MRFSLRKNRIHAMLLSAAMLVGLAPATRPSAAADIRVYSSGAPSEVAGHVATTFSATAGHRVLLTVGAIGEIQITDAMRSLLKKRDFYAVQFEGTRHDAGDKLGFLIATIEFGLKHPEIAPEFRKYLTNLKEKLAGASA